MKQKKFQSRRRGRPPNRLLTDALREIKNTRSRFISLLVLSALAVCFLAGLRATAPDMKISADRYFDAQHLMDLRVVSTLGLGPEDVDALAAQPGVRDAEGAYTVDAYLRAPEKDHIVKVHSISDRINVPKPVEGRMPIRPNEIVTEETFLKDSGLHIGDTVVMETGEGAFADALAEREFTIVGTADTPLYIAAERGSSSLGTGRVAAYVLALPEAFRMDYFTDAYLLMEGTEELRTYSDAYDDLMEQYLDQLQPLADERAPLRKDTLLAEAEAELAKHQQELDDAKAEAQAQLADAKAELDEAKKELDEGRKQYLDGLLQYNDGLRQYQDGLKQYQDGTAELNKQLADARQQMAQAEARLDDAKRQLEAGQPALDKARADLDAGWAEYNANYALYDSGVQQYNAGLEQYQAGLKQYEEGKQQIAAGRAQLAEAKKQIDENETQLAAGEKQFNMLLDTLCKLSFPDMTPETLLAALRAERDRPADQRPVTDQVNGVLVDTRDTAQQVVTGLRTTLEDLKNDHARLVERLTQRKAEYEEKLAQPGLSDPQRAAYEYGVKVCDRMLEGLGQANPGLELLYQQILEELKQAEAQLSLLPGSADALLLTADRLELGRAALEEGKKQYADGVAQLDEAEAMLNENKPQLDEAKKQLDESKKQLDDAKKQLDSGLAFLLDGEEQYRTGADQAADGWRQYYQGLADLEAGKRQLAEESAKGQIKLAEAKAFLDSAKQQMEDKKPLLAEAKKQLDEGEAQYMDGYREYLKGKEEAELRIRDAQDELDKARRDISNIEDCQWYLLDRNTNLGYVSYSMDADRMGNLADVFPLIFFLVAALVCLTTMTRMVEEQRVAIGGLKALGYSKGAIAIKYVGYGFLASTIGSLIGLAVGLTLVPWIICTSWAIMYTTGPIYFSPEPLTSTIACLAAIGTVTLSALVACFKTLTAVPAQLMRPKAPPMGKRILLERITPLWRRLSFNHKITLRNLFRYKRRFWMTVIGIGGCAALIVTAFGLRDSLLNVMDKQYDELYTYTDQIGLVDKVTDGELREVGELLDRNELVEDWTLSRSEMGTAETDAYTVDVKLNVVKDHETLSRYISLRHRTDDEPVTLPDDGAVITEKMAILLELEPGDAFTLDNGDRRIEIKVADIIENYIQHHIYISDAYYQTLFGEAPAHNMVLIDCPGSEENGQKLAADLMALDGVTSISRMSDTRKVFGSSLESVDYAVLLIIVCAAALAFVVLYNLTNINITERMRELATLKVLGFYDGELSAYVYRENVILTFFGVAMGMFMGKLLHHWLILTVEIDMLMFGRTLEPASFGWAVLLTTIFSLLVNLAAHWKLKKLDMVESLKTVE